MTDKEYKIGQIEPPDEGERAYLESLIQSDYEHSHPDETFEDLKHRAVFSKEDKGLLRDWMALAIQRAISSHKESLTFRGDVLL